MLMCFQFYQILFVWLCLIRKWISVTNRTSLYIILSICNQAKLYAQKLKSATVNILYLILAINHLMLINNLIIIGLTIFLMSTITTSVLPVNAQEKLDRFKANFAAPFFGVNLPFGREARKYTYTI